MKHFHIGDILSVTTGRLVSPTPGLGGVWPLLDYMTGEELYNHQVPRAMVVCKGPLLAQHPQLADADCTGINADNHAARLAALVERYGETLPVAPLNAGEYEPRNPLAELAEMTDKPIVVVMTD